MAMTKVVIPKVEWIGTRAARKDAVADSQHNKSKKLKKPTINCKKRNTLASVQLRSFFFDGSKIVKLLAKKQSKVEWIGTRAARKYAVEDSQHNKSKKLKKPIINWEKKGIHHTPFESFIR